MNPNSTPFHHPEPTDGGSVAGQDAVPALKRFLDRLLSYPEGADLPASVQQEHYGTAVELGIMSGAAPAMSGQSLPLSELIENTRARIRLQERAHPADQALETMAAPPAMPDATP